jgi:hypothetical protein
VRNRLSDSVIERFYVLKSDKQIKEGLYQAFFKRRKIIASGNYHTDKKTGTWNFYKPNGRFVQRFNYDKNTLIYESAFDTLADVRYLIDKKLKIGDTTTRPVKIGGIYYGFIPYLNAFKLPFDTTDINTDYFDATIELLISPLGRLADYKVHLYSAYYQYNHTFNLDVSLFSEADRSFIPLTINHQPALSRITIECYVTQKGGLDFN